MMLIAVHNIYYDVKLFCFLELPEKSGEIFLTKCNTFFSHFILNVCIFPHSLKSSRHTFLQVNAPKWWGGPRKFLIGCIQHQRRRRNTLFFMIFLFWGGCSLHSVHMSNIFSFGNPGMFRSSGGESVDAVAVGF